MGFQLAGRCVALAISCLLLASCSAAGSGWQRYRNDTYGFTISYPPTWRVETPGPTVAPQPPMLSSFMGEDALVDVITSDVTSGSDDEPESLKRQGWQETDLHVKGGTAAQYTRPPGAQSPTFFSAVYIRHGQKQFTIGVNSLSPSLDANRRQHLLDVVRTMAQSIEFD